MWSFFFSDRVTWQNVGLAAFVATTLGIIAILGYDYYLYCTGQVMITTYCRANPWCAWLILTVLQFGILGLAIHFMAPVPIEVVKP